MKDKIQEGSNTYALETGDRGAKRLNIQNDLLKGYSQDLLTKAGLAKGMNVLDIACGNGTMTAYLAKQVGPHGHVYALDISKDQLRVAKEHLAQWEKTFTNIPLNDKSIVRYAEQAYLIAQK